MINKSRYITMEDTIFYHGEAVTCIIRGKHITNAKISLEDDEENDNGFICQNHETGSRCLDMLGYSKSYVFSRGTSIGFLQLKKLKNTDTLGEVIYTIL